MYDHQTNRRHLRTTDQFHFSWSQIADQGSFVTLSIRIFACSDTPLSGPNWRCLLTILQGVHVVQGVPTCWGVIFFTNCEKKWAESLCRKHVFQINLPKVGKHVFQINLPKVGQIYLKFKNLTVGFLWLDFFREIVAFSYSPLIGDGWISQATNWERRM